MKTSLHKSLKNYLLVSGAVLGAATAADAQSIRFVSLGDTYDTDGSVEFDLDNDGNNDIELTRNISYTNANNYEYSLRFGNLGTDADDVKYFIENGYAKPYDLNTAFPTVTTNNTAANPDLGYSSVYTFYNSTSSYGTRSYSNGNFSGVNDKYIVFVFEDAASGNTYRGWIRVDVASDYSSITIDSYAIETVEGVMTTVGQTTYSAASVADAPTYFPKMWVNDNNELQSTQGMDGQLKLTDMSGAVVYDAIAKGTSVSLPSLTPGVYVAQLYRNDVVITEKVVIK